MPNALASTTYIFSGRLLLFRQNDCAFAAQMFCISFARSASSVDLIALVRRLTYAATRALPVWLVACSSVQPHTVSADVPARRGHPVDCSLSGLRPEVLVFDGSDSTEWHGKFDMADLPRLWQAADMDADISRFRDAVRLRLGSRIDAKSLIERQRTIFAELPEEWRGEAVNGSLVLEGRAGTIEPINCIEAMLWKWQAARFPMLEHPTEFGAFVLRRDGRMRIYLSSADLVGQRLRSGLVKLVEADVANGFEVVAHSHNHPFLFDRRVGDRMWTWGSYVDDGSHKGGRSWGACPEHDRCPAVPRVWLQCWSEGSVDYQRSRVGSVHR
jgi:hypothetical protein